MKGKKPGLAIAIMNAKPKAEEEASEDEDMKGSAFKDASAEAFEALQSGDMEGFQAALRAAIEMC